VEAVEMEEEAVVVAELVAELVVVAIAVKEENEDPMGVVRLTVNTQNTAMGKVAAGLTISTTNTTKINQNQFMGRLLTILQEIEVEVGIGKREEVVEEEEKEEEVEAGEEGEAEEENSKEKREEEEEVVVVVVEAGDTSVLV